MVSNKQLKILTFPYTDYQAVICDGAVRSGKTCFCIISFILWAMEEYNTQNFGICGKTVASSERNIVKPLLNIKFLTNKYKIEYKKTDSLLVVTDYQNKKVNFFYVFGGKDESSYQLIQGITLAGILFDEVALMPQSFVNQGMARCSVEGSRFFFNCNPASPNHWFYNEWIKQADSKNALYLHFTMNDNPSLSEETKKRYESLYTGMFYDRYIKGEWVAAEGLIYPYFASHQEEYLVDDVKTDDIMMIINGVDFGGTKSADAFVSVAITKQFRNVYVLDSKQIDYNGVQPITSDELNKMFIAFNENIYNKYGIFTQTYCDNAEPKLIASLKYACIDAKAHTNISNAIKDEIVERIECVSTLIKQHRLKVLRHNKNFIQAMLEAVWDEKKSTPEKDVRLDDGSYCVDLHDAFEYCIERYIKNLYSIGGKEW